MSDSKGQTGRNSKDVIAEIGVALIEKGQIGTFFGLFLLTGCLGLAFRFPDQARKTLDKLVEISPIWAITATVVLIVKIPAQRAGLWFGVYKTPGLIPQRGLSLHVVPTGFVIG